MNWIDDDIAKRKRRNEVATLIVSGAEQVYDELWNEIAACVKYANEKLAPATMGTNGLPHNRVVWLSEARKHTVLRIELVTERSEIAVMVDDSTFRLTLRIGVCSGDIVCLKLDDRKVDYREAAQLILEPFMFPDVQATTV
jgi:hypothetical protein